MIRMTFTVSVLFLSFSLMAFFQQDNGATLQTVGKNQSSLQNTVVNSAKADLLKDILANSPASSGSRAPISYTGTNICEGQVYSGTAVAGGISNSAVWDYYSFNGTAGDIVTITVERTGNCFMDPAFSLFFGTTGNSDGVTDDNGGPSMQFLAFQDDDFLNCIIADCFSDPILSNYVLPFTGTYTVAVYDFISCGGDPLTYDLTIQGISCPIPTMSEWGLIILALLMLQGIWFTLIFKPVNALREIPTLWLQGLRAGLQDRNLMLVLFGTGISVLLLMTFFGIAQAADMVGIPFAIFAILPSVHYYRQMSKRIISL
jgi:hypothetical protein